jgi:DNA-binding transcriptional MerR regulator
MALTIGQVARTTGVAAKRLRYYEQVGVLPPPGRTAAGYRQYTEQDVQRVVFIRRARALGLSLHHLKALTAALNGGPRAAIRPRLLELLRAHRSTVRRRITELRLLQRQLERLVSRLQASSPARPAGGCRCLELDDAPLGSATRGNGRDR